VRLAHWTVAALLCGALAACQANDDAFYDDVFSCSTGGPADPCGTTRSGKPMVCYPGSQLGGGTDFCTERCDPDAGVVEDGYKCLASGALLKKCYPTDAGTSLTGGCPPKLSCYRTNVISDEGVCLWMPVCNMDSDCTADSQHPKCTATLINDLFPAVTTDHLYCTQDTCASSNSTCAPNEACAANFYDSAKSVADICVPRCLGNHDCPPNFACANDPNALGAPKICLPGVPGERCDHDQDCLLGICYATGAGFNECVPPLLCMDDISCSSLDVDQTFVCANKVCIGLTPFHGAACVTSTDCMPGEICSFYSPYGVNAPRGECRLPCEMDLTCSPRGGVPHVCLDDGAGGCYPGDFGLPCSGPGQCLSSFECTAVAPDPRSIIDSPSICTVGCTTDDDCQNHPVIRGGFCEDGVCRLPGQTGAPCDRGTQCNGKYCNTAIGQCP
jgi:hypothetical protein